MNSSEFRTEGPEFAIWQLCKKKFWCFGNLSADFWATFRQFIVTLMNLEQETTFGFDPHRKQLWFRFRLETTLVSIQTDISWYRVMSQRIWRILLFYIIQIPVWIWILVQDLWYCFSYNIQFQQADATWYSVGLNIRLGTTDCLIWGQSLNQVPDAVSVKLKTFAPVYVFHNKFWCPGNLGGPTN